MQSRQREPSDDSTDRENQVSDTSEMQEPVDRENQVSDTLEMQKPAGRVLGPDDLMKIELSESDQDIRHFNIPDQDDD